MNTKRIDTSGRTSNSQRNFSNKIVFNARLLITLILLAFLLQSPSRASDDMPYHFVYHGKEYRAPTFAAAFKMLQSLADDGEYLKTTGEKRAIGSQVAWQVGYADVVATKSSEPARYSSRSYKCTGSECYDYGRFITWFAAPGRGWTDAITEDGPPGSSGWFCSPHEYEGQTSDYSHVVWARLVDQRKSRWFDIHEAKHSVSVRRTDGYDDDASCDPPQPPRPELVSVSKLFSYDCLSSYKVKEYMPLPAKEPLCENTRRYEIFGPNDQVCEPDVGNPCGLLSGQKKHTELDLTFGPLVISRTYWSQAIPYPFSYKQPYGKNWVLSVDRRITNLGIHKYWIDAAGVYRKLEAVPGGYVTTDSLPKFLESDGSTLTFRTKGRVEKYASGRLVEVMDGGKVANIVWEGGRVSSIVSNSDVLKFIYDDIGMLSRIFRESSPDVAVEFVYDSERRLTSVASVDGSNNTYLYEDPELPNALTGLIKNGERISSYRYDQSGAVIETANLETGEHYWFERLNNSVRVTDRHGANAEYGLAYRGGRMQVSTVLGTCAGCPDTDVISIEHDSNGRVSEIRRRSGVIETFERDSNGQIIRESVSVNGVEQYQIERSWSPIGSRLLVEQFDNLRTSYQYDTENRLKSRTESDLANNESRTITWFYDAFDQIVSVDGPRTDVNDVTTYTYDDHGNLAAVTNASGHVTRYMQYDAHGNPLEVIDPNGVVTELEYDLRQRLVRRTVAAGTASAATTQFEYDLAGQLVKTTLPNGAWIAYEYDAAHRMTAITDKLGYRIDYVLDAMGNRVEEKVSGPNGESFRKTFREYNQLNRLVVESGPEGSVMAYDYDAEGNRTETTDAFSHTTTHRYDALNRLVETIDALSGVTSYEYDPRDNLTKVVDPRGVTTDYTYNGFNELIQTDSPDAGTTTYAYDQAGNRISQTDARGITVTYEYDALDRLIFIDYPGEEQDIRYTYDQGPNGIGRLTRIDDETGHTEYSYDIRGNLIHKLSVVNTTNGEQYMPVGYSHDSAENLTDMTYPSGDLVQYQRDAAGRVTGINLTKADGTQVSLVTEIQYAPFGPATRKTYGNGITETRSFDREGRITRIQSSLLDYSYSWNAVSNITAITDNLDSTRTQNFDYDALYRLTDATGIYGNLNWQYDVVGNRTFQSDNGADTLYGYESASNRLANLAGPEGNVVYQYDEAGNTLDNGTNIFAYDARNRFVEADGQYRYAHNALGQRVTKPRFQTSVPGDLDGDGIIDENDLLLLRDILRGRAPANPAADCNGDGVVDNKDTSCIANQIGGNKSKGNGKGNRGDVGASSGANLSTMDATASSDGPGTIVGQIFFAYDESGHLIGEYDELGNVIREYVWLGDQPIAMFQDDGVYYIHSDHLNTPKVVTDANQQIVWKADYKPFGEVEETISNVEMNLRFPGQYEDNETGLHYNFNRFFDPTTGRYLSSDPIGLIGGINTYLYVDADPLTKLDPLGLAKVRSMKCGADNGIKVQDNFGFYNFSDACAKHDKCYEKCRKPKSSCDKEFLGDLNRVCQRIDPSLGFVVRECQMMASEFYLSVRLFGGPAYREAQKKACKNCEQGD